MTVVGATSVSSTVLLGSPHAAWRYPQFLVAAQTLAALPAAPGRAAHRLARAQHAADFKESLLFLESGGLIQRLPGDGDVIRVPAEKRIILDFYKNNTIHFFLLPALLSRALLAGRARRGVEGRGLLVAGPVPLGVPAAGARGRGGGDRRHARVLRARAARSRASS